MLQSRELRHKGHTAKAALLDLSMNPVSFCQYPDEHPSTSRMEWVSNGAADSQRALRWRRDDREFKYGDAEYEIFRAKYKPVD